MAKRLSFIFYKHLFLCFDICDLPEWNEDLFTQHSPHVKWCKLTGIMHNVTPHGCEIIMCKGGEFNHKQPSLYIRIGCLCKWTNRPHESAGCYNVTLIIYQRIIDLCNDTPWVLWRSQETLLMSRCERQQHAASQWPTLNELQARSDAFTVFL